MGSTIYRLGQEHGRECGGWCGSLHAGEGLECHPSSDGDTYLTKQMTTCPSEMKGMGEGLAVTITGDGWKPFPPGREENHNEDSKQGTNTLVTGH